MVGKSHNQDFSIAQLRDLVQITTLLLVVVCVCVYFVIYDLTTRVG
jgi:hypothetical protein